MNEIKVTELRMQTLEMIYLNSVSHDCPFGEFIADLAREVEEFLAASPNASQVDIFWHLDSYCDVKYTGCHTQRVNINILTPSQPSGFTVPPPDRPLRDRWRSERGQ